MKRLVPFLLCLLAGGYSLTCAADVLSEAAALAAQRDAEERYKRLAADVQTVLETQEVLLKRQDDLRGRLDKLADEFRALKEDQIRSGGNLVSRDELRKFVEKLREIDEKRESDKKLILENIKDLAKLPVVAPVETKAPARQTSDSSEEPPFIYVVKKNDRLLDIIAEYNAYFKKHGQARITMAQVLKANPGLKPDRLVSGSKVRIPVPPKDTK